MIVAHDVWSPARGVNFLISPPLALSHSTEHLSPPPPSSSAAVALLRSLLCVCARNPRQILLSHQGDKMHHLNYSDQWLPSAKTHLLWVAFSRSRG